MPDNVTTGDHAIGDLLFGATYGGQYNADSQTYLGSSSGNLKITKHDKLNRHIEGSFHFEAYSFFSGATASLTAGSFSVHY